MSEPNPAALQTAPTPLTPALPASIPCPACDYPVALGASRCSECGYQCAPDEWAHAMRREIFLQINRGAWIGPIILCALVSLFTPFFVTLFFLVLYLAATALIGAKFAGLYRRLLRQIWLVSLPWLLIPWMVALPVLTIAPEWIFGWTYSSDIPRVLHLSGKGAFGGVIYPMAIIAFNLLCWRVWQWRWSGLCRLAAVPAGMQRSGAAIAAARLAFVPALLLAVVGFLIFGSMNLLDAFVPGWDR